MQCAVLSAGIVLQLNKSTRELSLGLIVIWLASMFTRALWSNRNKKEHKQTNILYGTSLGLALIQARTITQREDEEGITQFLLIAGALIAGSSLKTKEMKALLQWLGVTAASISLILLSALVPDYSYSEQGMTQMYEKVFREGLGDINSLRFVLALLTAFSATAAILSQNKLNRFFMASFTVITYIAVIPTGSRMAMIAPIIALIIALLIQGRSAIAKGEKHIWQTACWLGAFACGLMSWKLVIEPDLAGGMTSDSLRVRIWLCWLKSITTGSNRFLHGFGHNNKHEIAKVCNDKALNLSIDSTITSHHHAHNTIVNIISHHGILGLVAITILAILLIRSLLKTRHEIKLIPGNLAKEERNLLAANAMTGVTLLICALSNTIYNQNQVLNILIGLSLAIPFCSISAVILEQDRHSQI